MLRIVKSAKPKQAARKVPLMILPIVTLLATVLSGKVNSLMEESSKEVCTKQGDIRKRSCGSDFVLVFKMRKGGEKAVVNDTRSVNKSIRRCMVAMCISVYSSCR